MIDTIQQQLINEGIQSARQMVQRMKQGIMKLVNTELIQQLVKLEDTLNSIDDINNISAKALQIEQFSLKELLDAAYQMYHLYFRRHEISFSSYVTNLQVKVDKASFFRMFFNLVHYMGQHIHPEEDSFIAIEAAAYNTQTIALYIEDNGVYPTTETDIFDPSFKHRMVGAISGVGLSAIRQWAESVQGSIHVVDKVGQGLKLCLLLPGNVAEHLGEKALGMNGEACVVEEFCLTF